MSKGWWRGELDISPGVSSLLYQELSFSKIVQLHGFKHILVLKPPKYTYLFGLFSSISRLVYLPYYSTSPLICLMNILNMNILKSTHSKLNSWASPKICSTCNPSMSIDNSFFLVAMAKPLQSFFDSSFYFASLGLESCSVLRNFNCQCFIFFKSSHPFHMYADCCINLIRVPKRGRINRRYLCLHLYQYLYLYLYL